MGLVAAVALLLAAQEKEPQLLLTWGAPGNKPGEFHPPIGLAIGPADEVVVTDCHNARVGVPGPIGGRADRHGRAWVSSLTDRVQCCTADGRYLMGITALARPHGLAIDRAGHLSVAGSGRQQIRKYRLPGG